MCVAHTCVQDTESQVGQLELMGFEKEAAQRALLLKGEVDAALTFLMEEKKKAPPVDNNVSSPPTPAPLKATTKEFVPTASPTSTSPRMPSTTVPTTEEQLILAGYKGALCQMFMQVSYVAPAPCKQARAAAPSAIAVRLFGYPSGFCAR